MKNKRVWAILLLVLIMATVLFIWFQSLLPATVSSQESTVVWEKLQEIINRILPVELDHGAIREWAHFGEFAVLGVLVSLAGRLLAKPDKRFYIWYFGPAISAADEGTQIFTEGRAWEWADILEDCAGYFVGVIAVFFIVWLIQRRKSKNLQKK